MKKHTLFIPKQWFFLNLKTLCLYCMLHIAHRSFCNSWKRSFPFLLSYVRVVCPCQGFDQAMHRYIRTHMHTRGQAYVKTLMDSRSQGLNILDKKNARNMLGTLLVGKTWQFSPIFFFSKHAQQQHSWAGKSSQTSCCFCCCVVTALQWLLV